MKQINVKNYLADYTIIFARAEDAERFQAEMLDGPGDIGAGEVTGLAFIHGGHVARVEITAEPSTLVDWGPFGVERKSAGPEVETMRAIPCARPVETAEESLAMLFDMLQERA